MTPLILYYFLPSITALAVTNRLRSMSDSDQLRYYPFSSAIGNNQQRINTFFGKEMLCNFSDEDNCGADYSNYDDIDEITASDQNNQFKVEKKHERRYQRVNPDCDCRAESKKIYIGLEFYPKYLINVTCGNDKCAGNTYCAPTTYPVKVLTRRRKSQADNDVPRELRRRWIYVEKKVVTDCMCAYKIH